MAPEGEGYHKTVNDSWRPLLPAQEKDGGINVKWKYPFAKCRQEVFGIGKCKVYCPYYYYYSTYEGAGFDFFPLEPLTAQLVCLLL